MATINPPNKQKPIQHQCLRQSHNEKFGLATQHQGQTASEITSMASDASAPDAVPE
jgi:hypothetical protein